MCMFTRRCVLHVQVHVRANAHVRQQMAQQRVQDGASVGARVGALVVLKVQIQSARAALLNDFVPRALAADRVLGACGQGCERKAARPSKPKPQHVVAGCDAHDSFMRRYRVQNSSIVVATNLSAHKGTERGRRRGQRRSCQNSDDESIHQNEHEF